MHIPTNRSDSSACPEGTVTFGADATFAAHSVTTQAATTVPGVRFGAVVLVSAQMANGLTPGIVLQGSVPTDGVVLISLTNTWAAAANLPSTVVRWMVLPRSN
jgi:lipid-binding SYLF domain-containing protein